MGSKAIILVVMAAGCSSVMSSIAGGAGYFLYSSNTSNAETTTTPAASTTPAGASGSGNNITINGDTFNPNGYTISKGYIWNIDWTKDAITPTQETSPENCKKKCDDNNSCSLYAYRRSGQCDMWRQGEDTVHTRGLKTDTGKPYITAWVDHDGAPDISNISKPSDCLKECNKKSGCIGFAHRNNTHADTKLSNTCILYKNTTTNVQDNIGFSRFKSA